MNTAAVSIIINEGLILGVTRKLSKKQPEKLWGLSGGKAESGELMGATAVRETKEETGISIAHSGLFFIFERVESGAKIDGIDFRTTCFYAPSWSGKIKAEEGLDVEWITLNTLLDKKTGAFPDYNNETFLSFKEKFPKVFKTLK